MNDETVPQEKGGNAHRTVSTDSGHKISGRSTHRRKLSRNQKKALRYLIVSWVLGSLLFVTITGWILTGSKLSSVKSKFLEFQISTRQKLADSKQMTSRAGTLEGEVKTLQEELATLIQGRIPNLMPLEFDVTVPSDQAYLKNISFTLTGTASDRQYEYRAVLHNDRLADIQPDVSILLFDAMGIQVGMAKLSNDHATSQVEHNDLKPGETRAYSSGISLDREAEPNYFLIEVK